MLIEISDQTKEQLDNLRISLIKFSAGNNRLHLTKAFEGASYDRLILLLKFGFSEKILFDLFNLGLKQEIVNVVVDDKVESFLIGILKEKI